VGAALGDWLIAADSFTAADAKVARWDLIELANVAPHDDCRLAMQQRLSQAGYTVHERAAMSCWRIALPPAWEAYVSSLSKPNRRRVRACQKRLQEPDAVRHVAKTPEQLQAGWHVLVDLHQQRRQSLGEAGCFASGEFERFLLSAAEQFLAEGNLRLSWIELAGSPAACVIAFRGGDVTYAYQMGISTRHMDENPGWLAHSAAIADALVEGCSAYDLLRGDEPYKGHLKAEPHAMLDLRIVPRRLAPQLRHTAWLTGLALKGALKLGLAATGVIQTGMH
jgi:CelD/BcsL family acetyltransferase involved in cellulose biosynthesis